MQNRAVGNARLKAWACGAILASGFWSVVDYSTITTEILDWNACPEYEAFMAASIQRSVDGDICNALTRTRPSFEWSLLVRLLMSSHAGKDLVISVTVNQSINRRPGDDPGECAPAISAILKVKQLHMKVDSIAAKLQRTDIAPFDYFEQWLTGNYGQNKMTRSFLAQIRTTDLNAMEATYRRCQQDEFVFLSLLPFSDIPDVFYPKLIGTCGDGFIVEHFPTVFSGRFILDRGWSEIRAAVQSFLALAQQLTRNSLEICDVKFDNFAWNAAEKSAVLIDLDSMFIAESLTLQFSGQPCRHDEECHFFDCRGACDSPSGTCRNATVDSNLARICRKIFLSGFFEPGLLAAAPWDARPELVAWATRCGAAKTTVEMENDLVGLLV